MIGQINLFSTELRVSEKVDCHDCACGRHNGYPKNISEPCLYYDCPGLECPEAKQRKPEDNPDLGPLYIDELYEKRWVKEWCSGCHRCLPVKDKHGNYKRNVYGAESEWRPYINHRYYCKSYVKTTRRTEECLMFPIQSWKLPDGSIVRWCAICEANGCEDCYEEWNRRFEEFD